MKSLGITALYAMALLLAACGPKTTTDTSANTITADTTVTTANDTGTATTVASGGQTFANAAAASDAFEIATSRLALANSSSPAVKKFAQKMIDAHTDSTAKLKTAAADASPAITPDPTLSAEQQAKVDALKTASGAAFNQAYIDAQTGGHQQTLDALRAYSSTGDVPQLKSFAATLVPIVTAHLNMAKGLKA